MRKIQYFLTVIFISVISTSVFARGGGGGGGGGHSMGVGVIFMSPGQDDLDNHIGDMRAVGTNIDKFGTAYELFGQYQYRFSGTMFGMVIRPGYFLQSTKGGAAEYKLTGLTLFPMLRMYPLENAFIHFFMQVGVGYGRMTGELSQGGGNSVSFAGDAFGALAGLGAEFCFSPAHCVALEGNYRYLPIQRSLVTSVSGTPQALSQSGNGLELEYNNNDLKTTMTGIQGGLSYVLNF